jgi:hypothetical protein
MPAEPQAASSEITPGSSPAAAGAGSALLFQQDGERSAALGDFGQNPVLATLPLQLDVSVPIPDFRVRDLLALDKGALFETSWSYTEDLPVWCGGAQLMWTEFEVVDNVLSVRVTRVL